MYLCEEKHVKETEYSTKDTNIEENRLKQANCTSKKLS